MIRNVKGSSRPTLADILAGKHISNSGDERSISGDSHRSCLSELNSTQLPSSDVKNSGNSQFRKDGKSNNSSSEMERPNHLKLTNLQKRQLRAIFDEENGVRRNNIIRLLERLGIQPLPSRKLLESYFTLSNDSQSSLSVVQWISLVEDLFNLQASTEGNSGKPNGSPNSKKNITDIKKGPIDSHSGSLSKPPLSQTSPDNNNNNNNNNNQGKDQSKTASVSYTTLGANYLRNKGSEMWLTGSEEMDAALIKLFIHCGALDRRGRGIELFLEDFRRMSDLRQNSLPPKRIVWEAASSLSSWCVSDPSSTNTPTGDLCMTLSQFLALLQDEVQSITTRFREGDTKNTNFPIVSIVLAALSPEPMKRLCGTEIVEYLRNPATIKYVLKTLENSGKDSSHVANPTSFLQERESISTKLFSSPTASPSLPPRPVPANRSQNTLVVCDSLNSHLSYTEGLGSGTVANRKKRRTASSSVGSRSSSTLRSDRQKSEIPRYMEPKPMDEISASIIARSKARRVIDELRKNTIPINRYECFARIEFVQQALFDEANLGKDDDDDDDHDDDDDDHDDASESNVDSRNGNVIRTRNRFLRRKVNPPDVSGPLLPGMYRMGGGEPQHSRRVRQETFERLYRSRFGYMSSSNGLLMQRSSSLTNSAPSRSRSAVDNSTHLPSRAPTPMKRETSTPILSREEAPIYYSLENPPPPPQGQRRTSIQNIRQDSRPPLMLADIYPTPFLGVSRGSDRLSSYTSASNTSVTVNSTNKQYQQQTFKRGSTTVSQNSASLGRRSSVPTP